MKTSALHSTYVIDGVKQELSPARMLQECLAGDTIMEDTNAEGTIYDETIDPSPVPVTFSQENLSQYISNVKKLLAEGKPFPMAFSEASSHFAICKALIDALWKKGHFTLSDLTLCAEWSWNCEPIGNMSAFYNSVSAVSEYIDMLNLSLDSYTFKESDTCRLNIKALLGNEPDQFEDTEDDILEGIIPSSKNASMEEGAALKDSFQACEHDWIVYVPFDTCDFSLGGSAIAQSQGRTGHYACDPHDPDYFIDCYEVLREMVEDGVAIAGATVGEGGLMTTLQGMAKDGCGARIDLSGIMEAYSENDIIKILFAEVPGVVIQIKDIDYDYMDAEMLLQDVAWFPLGHPTPHDNNISVRSGESGLAKILRSLMGSQTPEGED